MHVICISAPSRPRPQSGSMKFEHFPSVILVWHELKLQHGSSIIVEIEEPFRSSVVYTWESLAQGQQGLLVIYVPCFESVIVWGYIRLARTTLQKLWCLHSVGSLWHQCESKEEVSTVHFVLDMIDSVLFLRPLHNTLVQSYSSTWSHTSVGASTNSCYYTQTVLGSYA